MGLSFKLNSAYDAAIMPSRLTMPRLYRPGDR
jgi:hypothetical protein